MGHTSLPSPSACFPHPVVPSPSLQTSHLHQSLTHISTPLKQTKLSMRAALRQVYRLFQETPEGREMVESEFTPEGYPQLSAKCSDEELDARIRE